MIFTFLTISCYYTLIGFNVIGITANILQIVLGILKTPDNVRVYLVLLVNSGICDMLACATAVFVQQRLLSLLGNLNPIQGRYPKASVCFLYHTEVVSILEEKCVMLGENLGKEFSSSITERYQIFFKVAVCTGL